MKRYVIAAITTLLLISFNSQAASIVPLTSKDGIQVMPGCVVPSAKSGRTFYVDPVNGSIANDGSAAHPWHTLAEAIATMARKPVLNAGDTILLMNGNHGIPYITLSNADFVTVMPAPGQKPVLGGVNFGPGASKWILKGLTIQGLIPGRTDALVKIGSDANNIIINNNQILSQDSVNGWSQQDWLAKARMGIVADGRGGARCVSISKNILTNLRNAVALSTNNSVFDGNIIDNFAGDGLDFGASNLLISHNRITNNNYLGDSQHLDGMQGFEPAHPSGGKANFRNITIDGNTVIRQTDARLRFPSYMQGISAFDENWTNLAVTNNVVITNCGHAISFGSVHDGRIANNTVMLDGNLCPSTVHSWIGVFNTTHGGTPSNDVTVINNIADTINVAGVAASVTAQNNMAAFAILDLNGKTSWIAKPGVYGKNNTVVSNLDESFMLVDRKADKYDVRLKPTSAAIGGGAASQAPAQDIAGTVRPKAVDLGAYQTTSPVIKYKGTVMVTANARQVGSPKLTLLIDGVEVEALAVTADVHVGQIGYLTFSFTAPAKPKQLGFKLEGFKTVATKYDTVQIFKVAYAFNGSASVDLLRRLQGETTGNAAVTGTIATFQTNGSLLKYDLGQL